MRPEIETGVPVKARGRRSLNWRHVMIVARKEATDTLRDRRTWVAMILVPILLVPILLLVAPTAAMTQMESVAQSVAHVAVVGGDGAQGFLDFLSQRPGLVLQESADPEADLAARKVQAVLYLPFGFDAAIAAERPVSLEITYDAADQRSSMAHDRLWMAINSFSAAVAEQRLLSRGVDPALLRPVSGSSRNVAPPAKMGGVFLSMIMPMLLGIWAGCTRPSTPPRGRRSGAPWNSFSRRRRQGCRWWSASSWS